MKMKIMFKRTSILICFVSAMLFQGCYQSQYFDMPGNKEEEKIEDIDVPFPFDPSRNAGVYMVKNGTPDYTKMAVHGFTDFATEIAPEVSSWYSGVDHYGRNYFGCRQHKNFYQQNDADNFGGDKFSYQYNDITSRFMLPQGPGKQWYMYARLAINNLGHDSRPTFYYEGGEAWERHSSFGVDWHSSGKPHYYLYRKGGLASPLTSSFYYCYNTLEPGEEIEIEIACVDRFYYVRINGQVMWTYGDMDVTEHLFPLVFRPWMNSVKLYDLYVEGGVDKYNAIATQHEAGYVNIQAPTLVKTSGDVVLFAEGHLENVKRTDRLDAVRSNATDIITRRSTDGGTTWSNWTAVKGKDNSVNMYPSAINTEEGLHLFYTLDRTGKQGGDYQLMQMTSNDEGRTWGEAKAIDVQVQDGLSIDGYTLMTLTGKGICTKSGRLILPVFCKFGTRGTVATIYSDDNGATWTASSLLEGLRNISATVVETENKLLMVVGHTAGGTSRKIAESTDGGQTWGELTDGTLPTKDGQASNGVTLATTMGKLVHFSATNYKKGTSFTGGSLATDLGQELKARKTQYLFRAANYYCGGMIFTSSDDQGETWSDAEDMVNTKSYNEYDLLTGRVDAILLNDNTALVVVEGGAKTPYEGLISFKKTW